MGQTLRERRDHASVVLRNANVILAKDKLSIPEHVNVTAEVINGNKVVACHCTCGRDFRMVMEEHSYRLLGRISCPSCGCKRVTDRRTMPFVDNATHFQVGQFTKMAPTISAVHVMPNSSKENWMVIAYNPEWSHAQPSANEDWIYSKAYTEMYPQLVLSYDAKTGFAIAQSGDTKPVSERSEAFHTLLNKMKHASILNNAEWREWVQEAAESEAKKARIRQEANEEKKKSEAGNMAPESIRDISTYPSRSYNTIIGLVLNEDGKKKEVSCQCMACETKFRQIIDKERREEVTCPSCGVVSNRYSGPLESFHENETFYEATPTGALLVRFVKTSISCTGITPDGLVSLSEKMKETLRYFVTRNDKNKVKEIVMTRNVNTLPDEDIWEIGRKNDLPSSWNKYICRQDKEEVLKAIQASSMAKTGLAEAYGLVDQYRGTFRTGDLYYITMYKDNPSIELLAKANLPNIFNEVSNAWSKRLFPKATSLPELLGASMRALRFIENQDGIIRNRLMYARQLDEWIKRDPSITVEQFAQVLHDDLATSRIDWVMQQHQVPLHKILSYLQTVYDYQCINKAEALRIWDDYLRMAEMCGFDLSDKQRKFPSSLKKEHDVALFAWDKIKTEKKEYSFRKTAELNKWLEWCPKEKKFLIRVPMTPEEVVEEATAQHNCLRSYLERIVDGRTRVVFLRKADAPEIPFVTIEVDSENRVAQVKAKYNQEPGKPEKDFAREWAKVKGLNFR